MDPNRLRDLIPDGINRRERRERVLEDHGDPAAADLGEIFIADAQKFFALETDRSRDTRAA